MTQLMNNSIHELNILHKNIEGKLKSTVHDAIMAGEILTNVKEKLAHGEFLPWIEKNCIFTRMTASNYMRVYEHKSKCITVLHLPEAYKLVAKLESVKKQTENQKAFKRVQEFKKTGVKPEGWRKNTDDKIYQEDIDRDERIKQNKERMKDEWQGKSGNDQAFDNLIEGVVKKNKERSSFKNKIRLSFDGKEDSFIDALIDYLEELDDDNRRIEACNNIIKVTKNITKELQRKVYLHN